MDGTILIMDYSSYERQKMRHIIEKVGSFNIVEMASIGQFRLLNLEISDLKLVLLDLAFPTESDSFEVLRKIRSSENRNIPVIVVTQSDKNELKVEALKYSVNDYIKKPYQVKRLESSIKSFIQVASNFHYDPKFPNCYTIHPCIAVKSTLFVKYVLTFSSMYSIIILYIEEWGVKYGIR